VGQALDALPRGFGALAAGRWIEDDEDFLHGFWQAIRSFLSSLGDTLSAVKKVSKAILILIAAALVLAAVALLGINLYIQSPGAQIHIQDALSKALRMPLKITNTSLTPWGGLWIHGVTIPAEGTNFLEADSLHAHCRFLPLLSGRLEIAELAVENPKIHWVQDADGKWKLPALEKTAKGPKEKPKSAEKRAARFEVSLDHLLVKERLRGVGGSRQQDRRRIHRCHFWITAFSRPIASRGWPPSGAPHGRTRRRWRMSARPSPTSRGRPGALRLPELTATLAGGKVTGHFQAWPEAEKSPFETGLVLKT
jgi:hypothetical protein